MFRSQKIPESQNFGRTIFFLQNEQLRFKNTKLRFKKHEVSVRKPEVSVRKPEVSGKNFEPETSVKVVFRNASVAETRNFDLLCWTKFYKFLKISCTFKRLETGFFPVRNLVCIDRNGNQEKVKGIKKCTKNHTVIHFLPKLCETHTVSTPTYFGV
jgi:hypothetical protein